jgi:hypothetical protein
LTHPALIGTVIRERSVMAKKREVNDLFERVDLLERKVSIVESKVEESNVKKALERTSTTSGYGETFPHVP